MKRSLLCLLLALGALAACNDKPPGQLEPIPRPADYKEPPKPAAPKPPPPADPNKVTLRWKLAEGAPVALKLEGTPSAATVYVLQRPKTGERMLRLAPEGAKAPTDQGTFSERGFMLDGLNNVDRNLATLVMELPKDAVRQGDTWSLGLELVDTARLGRDFAEKKAERHNTVKLSALVSEGDERIATIEYDMLERVSGILPPAAAADEHTEKAPIKAPKGKGKGKEEPKEAPKSAAERPVTAEVTFTGRGEFLVKAGRWRSWEGTLSSKTEGYTPPSPDQAATLVPPGTLKLKLTALDSAPAQLLQPEPKK
ncbi:MAG: hypothetical protein ACJ8AT_30590 [Hyalangium sp.]|uniref:hypothetical protein n=1 Tax=Hyalangium sp. TaxID=2028555 RepID=UPI00389A6E95